jgi:hypothetical protein
VSVRAALEQVGQQARELAALPTSTKTFPDGAAFRIEIPSVEGPAVLDAVIEEGSRLGVPVHRVSQGSGVAMLLDRELDEMADTAAANRLEVSLFTRPNAAWHLSASSRAPAGSYLAPTARGQEQVVFALEEAERAAAHGFRSVLIADFGTLAAFCKLREAGYYPPDMQVKVSVSLPVTNASTARLLQDIGANTLNLAPDLDLAQIATIRAAVDLPIDVYIETPDSSGGVVRVHELGEIVRIGAPIYIKFGLRNAPDVYPSGRHIERLAADLGRERVRRAALGLEALGREHPDWSPGALGADDLAIPVR